ncbi:hypothetical protein [Nocardioides aurantiacus]|uniref:Uncharacterized protein n=1 Tax=Nocardioides aurantiacus TaxID=86796 RepID=A0A3N2CVM3_9ACTN|nr:hypothetical protein [Nocardioides aurantiacus]ROR91468.1 hypothetical protein EDD33_2335 [Nocardioides aurantiacus]
MPALTLSEVASWQPHTLRASAESLTALTRDLLTRVEDIATAKIRLNDAWEGWAADSAAATTQRHAASGKDLAETLTRTSQTLTWGSAALTAAQETVAESAQAARGAGCTVDDDGTAHPPPISAPENPLMPLPALQPVQQQRAEALALAQARAQAAAMAARYTQLIQGNLEAAAATDVEVARTLSSITLPAAVATSAAETAVAVVGVGLGGDNPNLQVAFPDSWRLSDQMRPLSLTQWSALVGASLGLPVFALKWYQKNEPAGDRTGYYGGGGVMGPDGRMYPLVAPQVNLDGVLYGGDAQPGSNRVVDLRGQDDGWHTIAHTSGVDRLAPLDKFTKGAAGLGVLAGGSLPSDPTPSRLDLRDNLTTNAGGFPTLGDAPPSGGSDDNSLDRPGKPFGDPRDNPIDKPPWAQPEVAGLHPDHAGRAQGGVDLLTQAGDAALTVKRLNDSESKLYDLTLEAHEDGDRTRALLRIYDVEEDLQAPDDDPKFIIKSSYGWLDSETGTIKQRDYNFLGAPESAGPNARYHKVLN